MSMIKPVIEKSTLSDQVRNYLLDLITTNKLEPGEKVPSEKQLIETLGVSRGVVREAFQALSILGILDISSGKHPRVQTVNSSALETIFNYSMVTRQISTGEILELRKTLEVQCAALAARHGSGKDFSRLRNEMENLRNVFGDHQQFIIHDSRFHLILAEASGNPIYALLLQALRAPLEKSIAAGLQAHDINDRREKIISVHQAILEKVCQRDEAGAREAMQDHFDSAINALIVQK
ncbi:FadR/GntR family transcriptional regulator [Serratia quinivorans]|uniref:FadR/GntR family transcriptional regulator n=1 Tax=Serratia quinivorans TaxID=137545 RepID=UPI00217A2F5A|nr:FadR/GntR family transcriptional regulator [Serratia quinivorans]CAI1033118.1 L-lactate utilization operon repressor [Serratia quinivorans]CAI1792661.1 L-lactate utilization operon repressor [Serratia quinivorans]